MCNQIRLSATSALVLLWSGSEIYRTPAAQEYWSRLDLSSGKELYGRCHTVWPYYDQVIKNRKWCIGTWCNAILTLCPIEQVVIVAAGFAPLGVELASAFPACAVFDVDLLNMPEKQKMCEGITGLGTNLHFVEADITDTEKCVRRLSLAGWQGNRPTLIICEGISYYISADASQKMWEAIAGYPMSRFIFEYMVPDIEVSPERRSIPSGVFGAIMDYCNIKQRMTTWSRQLLDNVNGYTLRRRATMHSIERERKGMNTIFPAPNDGWIEIAELIRNTESMP